MTSLDTAIENIAKYTTDQKRRSNVVNLIEGIITDCEAAIDIWQGYLDNPGEAGQPDNFVSWTGPEIAKNLHELHLDVRSKISEIGGTGVDLDSPIIEMAYRKLNSDETGMDAAATAISTMEERIEHFRGYIEQIRTTKPTKVKEQAKKAPAKKAVAKKAAAKKTVAKKAVVKKATTKKAVAKKTTAKKAVAKKKPATKKKAAVKKKVVKKAASKKKVVAKKKVAPKKAVIKKSAKKQAAKKVITKKAAVKKKPVQKKAAKKKPAKKK